jgi:hypothetical protein
MLPRQGTAPGASIIHMRSDAPQDARGIVWLHNSTFKQPPGPGVTDVVAASANMVVYSSDMRVLVRVEGSDSALRQPWLVQTPTGDSLPRLQVERASTWNLTTMPDLVRHFSLGDHALSKQWPSFLCYVHYLLSEPGMSPCMVTHQTYQKCF